MKIKSNSLFWTLQTAGWLVYALSMYFLFSKSKPEDYITKFLFLYSYVLGFLMTSFVLRYVLRFLKMKFKSVFGLVVSASFSVLVIVSAWYFIDVFSSMMLWEKKGIDNFFDHLTFVSFIRNNYFTFVIYFAWTAMYFGIKYWMEWQEEKKRTDEALLLAQKAQLQMLRYQLNPHFLFNSLNSIKALVSEDGNTARQMITELSEFLRYSLVNKDTTFRPLSEEIEVLKLYLSIEKKRFEEKIRINYHIQEETKNVRVLSFLLHPVIENAIKYGMKTSDLPLELSIRAYIEESKLVIEICNSGRWYEQETGASKYGTGTGLDNVKNRLENAYPAGHSFDIYAGNGKVCVKITMNTKE